MLNISMDGASLPNATTPSSGSLGECGIYSRDMKKTDSKKAKNFYNALKDNPQEIIEWCEAEIEEYKKLIEIIQRNMAP